MNERQILKKAHSKRKKKNNNNNNLKELQTWQVFGDAFVPNKQK